MSDAADMGEFQNTQINFAAAYHDARKLMGQTSTNLNDLLYNVGLMYLNAPTKWVEPFLLLMKEIETRQNMIEGLTK